MSWKMINGEYIQSAPIKLETIKDWILLSKNDFSDFCSSLSNLLPDANEMHFDNQVAIDKSINDLEPYLNEPEIIEQYKNIFYNIFSPVQNVCNSGCLPLFQYFIEKYEKEGHELNFFSSTSILEDNYIDSICTSGKNAIIYYMLSKISLEKNELLFKALFSEKAQYSLKKHNHWENVFYHLIVERNVIYTNEIKELIKKEKFIQHLFEQRELNKKLNNELLINKTAVTKEKM